MKDREPVRRWISDPARQGPIRDLIAEVGPAERLDSEATARIRSTIERSNQPAIAAPRRLALAASLAAIALAGVAAAATIREWWPPRSAPEAALPAPIRRAPSLPAERAPEAEPSIALVPPSAPVAAPAARPIAPQPRRAPIASETVRPAPTPPPPAKAATDVASPVPESKALPAPVVPPPSPEPSPAAGAAPGDAPRQPESSILRAESALLTAALHALHQQRDPARALALLDTYRDRYPRGELGTEALLARVQALLALGDRGPALELLDALPADRMPRRSELLTVRGELRAHAQRCEEAITDFSRALESGAAAELEERALFGRAACRADRGDRAGAHRDLTAYLAKFPRGRFAERAREALGALR